MSRRARSISFAIVAAGSLLVAIADAGLWARSFTSRDAIALRGDVGLIPPDGGPKEESVWWLASESGVVTLGRQLVDPMPSLSFAVEPRRAAVANHNALAGRWHERLGFSNMRVEFSVGLSRGSGFAWVNLPHSLVVALALILPGVWLLRGPRGRRRAATNACGHCGYDLRATPHRCPECGAARVVG